jgi:hypothetical protein
VYLKVIGICAEKAKRSLKHAEINEGHSKEGDSTSKCGYYCSQMQPFIAPKPGEGRV